MDVGPFHPYEELVEKGLSYLEKYWDGRLYSSPGDTKHFIQQTKTTENLAVRVLAKKAIGSQVWFQIQFVEGRCEDNEKLGKKAWILAYYPCTAAVDNPISVFGNNSDTLFKSTRWQEFRPKVESCNNYIHEFKLTVYDNT